MCLQRGLKPTQVAPKCFGYLTHAGIHAISISLDRDNQFVGIKHYQAPVGNLLTDSILGQPGDEETKNVLKLSSAWRVRVRFISRPI